MSMKLVSVCSASILSACAPAYAAEPVRHIGVYVQPYYEAARDAAGTPRVAVSTQYDALLASNRREDIVAARDAIEKATGSSRR